MKIAIVGCGYVGKAIAHRWSQDGHWVTATTTSPERIAELKEVVSNAVVMRGDDADAMRELLQDQEAVLVSVGDRSRTKYKETYLGTALNLVATLAQAPGLRQIIYTSSCSVYGDKNSEWVDEESPVAPPANEKIQTLWDTEQALLEASSPEVRVCILRLGGIYGPGREIVKIFRNVAGKIRPGTGAEPTNWIHLDDIVGALEFLRLKRSQGIYNLVHDVSLTSRELLDGLCQKHGLAEVSWDPSAPPTRSYNARVSNQKIKAAGFELIHPETML